MMKTTFMYLYKVRCKYKYKVVLKVCIIGQYRPPLRAVMMKANEKCIFGSVLFLVSKLKSWFSSDQNVSKTEEERDCLKSAFSRVL